MTGVQTCALPIFIEEEEGEGEGEEEGNEEGEDSEESRGNRPGTKAPGQPSDRLGPGYTPTVPQPPKTEINRSPGSR